MKQATDKILVSKVTKALPVHLTESEILQYGRDVARAVSDRERIKEEGKSIAKDYASKVAEQEAIIGKLSPRIHSGIETRDIECKQTKNWTAATVQIVRTDTGEIVESRPMREDEKQVELAGVADSED